METNRFYLTQQGKIGRFIKHETRPTTKMCLYHVEVEGEVKIIHPSLLSFIPSDKISMIKPTAK